MASQLRVNKSENRSGLGTITYTDTGAIVSGIVTANSFSGGLPITSGSSWRVVTSSNASTLKGETNLQFDGTNLYISDNIIHKDDTNTKIGFPAVDTFTVETAGDERLRITSDGKIGIGDIANPGGLLTVYDGASANDTPEILLSAFRPAIRFQDRSSSGLDSEIVGDLDSLIFRISAIADNDTALTEQMRLKSVSGSGYLGIGTHNPDQKLEVFNGAIKVDRRDNADTSNPHIDLRTGPAGASRLLIYGEDHTDDNSNWIYKTNSNEHHIFHTGGTERFRIRSSGNITVGSGCTDVSLFNVKGTAGFADDGTNAGIIISTDDANGAAIHCLTTGGFTNGSYGIMRLNAVQHKFTYGNTQRLLIDANGLATFGGEIAAAQQYPDFRPTVDFNFAAEKKLDPRITHERTGPASFVNEFGKVVLVGDNVPRFDHDPITRECKGLVIEESKTNINAINTFRPSASGTRFSINSADEQNAGENTNGVVSPVGTAKGVARAFFTGSETAPDGSVYVMASTSGSDGAIFANSNTHTSSVWIRTGLETVFKMQAHSNYASASAGGSASTIDFTFTLTGDGTVTSIESGGIAASVTKYPNNWYRCTLTYHRNSTSSTTSSYGVIVYPVNYASYNTNSVSGDIFWVWGPQVEESPFPTSYIPTYGTTVTRGADFVRIMDDDFIDIFGTEFENFSVVADFDNSISFDSNNASILEWWSDNNNYEDRIQIMKDNASPYHIETRAFGNNAAVFSNGNLSASSKAATNRFAMSWSVDYTTSNAANRKWAFSFSGEAVDVVGDNTGTSVPELTRFGIGCSPYKLDLTRGILLFKRLMVYNQTLSDSQLQNLSAR